MESLSISQVAKRGGVNIQTIRYYERQGLLAPTSRTEAAYRIFSSESVRRIRFIKRAQELGFSLKEIKDLLSLRIDAHATQADIRNRTQAKIADAEQKILHLQAISTRLNVFILFTGFGVGGMVFGAVVPLGFGAAFAFSVPSNCCSIWPLFSCFAMKRQNRES